MTATLISIIGPPAVGKSTLAELLCRDLGASLIREDWDGNPYLAESYDGLASARLPSQLYFLRSRVLQLGKECWPREGIFISDYGFCQDRIFARARLSPDEFVQYDRQADELAASVHPPDLLLHLRASADTLLARIAARGRDFEHVMDRAFLETMDRAYLDAVKAAHCPAIAVECDLCDTRLPQCRADLLGRIRQAIGALTQKALDC